MNTKLLFIVALIFMSFNNVTAQITSLELKANSGDAQAMFELAMLYRRGNGVECNHNKAVEWLKKASLKNHLEADYYLASYYESGEGGLPKDSLMAFHLHSIAANNGFLDSMFELGISYAELKDISNAAKESTEWLEKYAKLSQDDFLCSIAELELYFRYQGDYGIEKNTPLSMMYLWASVKHGNEAAYNVLGECYLKGEGVEKDKQEAIRYFLLASDRGCTLGDGNLGLIYMKEKQYDIAMTYLKNACENEYKIWPSVVAMRCMAFCYKNGLGGVKQDLHQASYWNAKADECKYKTTKEVIRGK